MTRYWILLLLFWSWLYLPLLGSPELRREEGHRVMATQEMLENSDWVMPTFLGEPYLHKPPGFYWAVMASAWVNGDLNEWSLRLVSALSILIGALLLACWSRNWLGQTSPRVPKDRLDQSAFLSGVGFLLTPEVWVKGTLGEIDAFFSVLILLALFLYWQSLTWERSERTEGSRKSLQPFLLASMSGFFLGWACLSKGPLGLLFFLLPAIAWPIVAKFSLVRYAGALFVAVGVSVVLCVGWVVLLSSRVSLEEALSLWSSEMGGTRRSADFLATLRTFGQFPIGIIFGFLPGVAALVCMWRRRKSLLSDERTLFQFILFASLPAILLLWIHGRKVRYALPVAAPLALACGLAWASDLRERMNARRLLVPLVTFVLLLGLGRVAIVAGKAARTPNRDLASRVSKTVPEDETLFARIEPYYINVPFYLTRRVKKVASERDLPAGEVTFMGIRPEFDSLKRPIKQILLEEGEHGSKSLRVVRLAARGEDHD